MKSINSNKIDYTKAKSFLNKTLFVAAFASITALYSCSSKSSANASSDSSNVSNEIMAESPTTTYTKLGGGSDTQHEIVRDTTKEGAYVYADSYMPIDDDILFVEASTGDTLYGPTGIIVNNALIQENGTWKVDKTKIKKDGDEIKIKSGDDKLKIDGEEMKMKTGDSKLKADEDEGKLKTPESKTKVEDDETKVKPQ